MILQIVLQSNNMNMRLINLTIIALFIFLCVKAQENSIKDNFVCDSLNVLYQEDVFAREYCDGESANFCKDLGDQIYRISPVLIKYNAGDDLYESYKKGIYWVYKPEEILNCLQHKDIPFKYGFDIDPLFNSTVTDSIHILDVKDYSEDVKKYAKKIGKAGKVKYQYEFYKVKMKYINGGQSHILLPNFYASRQEPDLLKLKVQVYYILDLEVFPLSSP